MAKKTTKKSVPKARFLKKVHALTEMDIFKSVAIASILFNVLFVVCILVLTNTATFDRSLYNSAYKHYCKNIEAVRERAEELGSESQAVREWQVTCVGSDFAPFYKEALDKYNAHQNQ